MVYERYPRNADQGDYYNRSEAQDYGHDYGSGREFSYSSARDYEAAGEIGDDSRGGYGSREYGNQRYGQRDQMNRGRGGYGGRDYGGGRYGRQEFGGRQDSGRQNFGNRDYYGSGNADRGYDSGYRGSYASDGRPFEDVGRYRHADDDNHRGRQPHRGNYGRQPQGYDYQDRGFMARAGDEVRSWFGDDDAERRREMDSRYDEQRYSADRDSDYNSWRSGQIAALDRDYNEYRSENRTKFHNEFNTWRTNRQGQRDQLSKVKEHMDVVGSDGEHVGSVDKVRGDRILLTKNDADAGGRHHSIPSSWIQSVDDKLTLTKSADDAKKAWRDEENSQAMFGYGDRTRQDAGDHNDDRTSGHLTRSFSGTY